MTAAKPDTDSQLPAAYAAAALTLLIWGATPAATKLAVDGIDPVLAGVLRTVLAAAIVLPLALLRRLALPRDVAGWRLLLLSSVAGFIAFTILFSLGVQRTSASHAALINASIPIFSGLFGAIAERRVPPRAWLFGMGVALAGEVFLIGFKDSSGGEATVVGDLLCLASSIAAGFGYVVGARASARIGSLSATFWGVGLAGLMLLPLLYIIGGDTDWAAIPMVSVSAIVYLALGSSVIAYVAWYWALGRGGIVRMAPVQFAMPVVSLSLAVLLLGETLT
ncbi:MAG: DMT family transporter, partial [Alphaproteobacteria bacterium]